MAKKQTKEILKGAKGVTKNPISKSIGGGEPLIIHVCMKEGPEEEEDEKEEKEDEKEKD